MLLSLQMITALIFNQVNTSLITLLVSDFADIGNVSTWHPSHDEYDLEKMSLLDKLKQILS